MLKRFLKLVSLGLILTLLVFTVAGCGEDTTTASKNTDTQTEEKANTVKRIISLTPTNTEILFALGLGDKVVGVTTNCNYPEEAQSKDKIGDWVINAEKVVDLEPDLILAQATFNSQETIDALKGFGLNVLILDPKNIQETFDSIKTIAEATGTQKEADELVKNLEAELELVKDKVATIPTEKKKKVFIEVGLQPLFTAGENSFVGELLTAAGGINVVDIENAYDEYSAERVVELNPDAILHNGGGSTREAVFKVPGWNKITAVKEEKVSEINEDILVRQGPRFVEGIKDIAKFLYPDLEF